jgi:hypothetical protein
MMAQAASIPRKIPGALRQPNIATIATRKTAGMMKMEEFTSSPLPMQSASL